MIRHLTVSSGFGVEGIMARSKQPAAFEDVVGFVYRCCFVAVVGSELLGAWPAYIQVGEVYVLT